VSFPCRRAVRSADGSKEIAMVEPRARRLSCAALPPLLTLLVCLTSGCHVPSRLAFSPDGTKAVYASNGTDAVVLIDDKGKILRPLGEGAGAAAWSPDGKVVYYTVRAPEGTKPVKLDLAPLGNRKLGGTIPDEPPPKDPDAPPPEVDTIYRYDFAGEPQPLVTLPGPVFRLVLSPDGKNLLSFVTTDLRNADHPDDKANATFAVVVGTGSRPGAPLTKVVAAVPGVGVGGAWLDAATVVVADSTDSFGELGVIRGVGVGGDGWVVAGNELAVVALGAGVHIDRAGDTLLVATTPVSLPIARAENMPEPRHSLFAMKPDGTLKPLVHSIGPLFTVSPDGKRVLIETIDDEPGGAPRRMLAVLDLATGQAKRMLDVSGFANELPVYPAWVGNEAIAFVAAPDTGVAADAPGGKRIVYELVIYRLDGDRLVHSRTLSADWKPAMKPGKRERDD
jgi:hypothetical protein